MRRSRIVRPRKRAIWVNVPFGQIAFTEAVGTQLLLTPEDWEAQFSGQANETAVLRAIVGDVCVQQTVVGTAGNVIQWGVYIADKDSTVPPVFTAVGLADYDWLHMGAVGVAGTLVTATTAAPTSSIHVRIKSKRRLRSRDAVYICAQCNTDAVSPAGTIGGVLRFLVARD